MPRQLDRARADARAAASRPTPRCARVISEYTREAGVRNLERQIGAVARKVAARIAVAHRREASPRRAATRSSSADATSTSILGPPRFKQEVAFRTSRPGVATGVAWTEAGGDVLFIEASLLPGGNQQHHPDRPARQRDAGVGARGASATSARRPRSSASRPDFLDKHDLHVHVPAGAIPKDGPSAGVTMATAILSALRKQPVREDVAMTGEITLIGPRAAGRRHPREGAGGAAPRASRRSSCRAERAGSRGAAARK